ncbi:MAG: hypothetical protein JWR49_1688 [Tardiphaga sp.]|jgi:hypothetical protein|nr:hypothetical protein [Tardiphaga sp.]
MITNILIALAAGAASALMFASIISGALISLLLFYLAPLPLMVAGLGWGPLAASIGGIAAGTGLGLLFGMPYLIAFVVTVALPAWWLGHLALLGRPVSEGVPATNGAAAVAPVVEWYPIGRILLWVAGFAALTTMGALLTLGTDGETILASLKRALMRIMGPRSGVADGDAEQLINALVTIAPAAAAIVAIMTLTLNLWLAGKITATSGRLHRAWPDLKSAELPPMTLVALCLAIALSFTGGVLGIFAQIVSSTLMMAYALTGFAALHTLTLGMKSRVLWLSSTYAVVLVFGWPILAMVGLGLADAFFGFRQRFLQRRPPPTTAA